MKKSPYSPDEFMSGLYGRLKADPYKDADSYEDAVRIGNNIKDNAKELFSLEKLNELRCNPTLAQTGKTLDYPEYTLKKYICQQTSTASSSMNTPSPSFIRITLTSYSFSYSQHFSSKFSNLERNLL